MSVNLSIKEVPDALAQRLRERAIRNHRSLQGELMAIIESAVTGDVAVGTAPVQGERTSPRRSEVIVRRGTKTIEQIAAELRALYPEPVTNLPLSVDIVRELRDSR